VSSNWQDPADRPGALDDLGLKKLYEDSPLYLQWSRQGKVWWHENWLRVHGPVRSKIPGLDDHIGFANYDLGVNDLPRIQTTELGQPFVICLAPLTAEGLALARARAETAFSDSRRTDLFLKDYIYRRMALVGSVLDVVHHHGFDPAIQTSGLTYLRELLPRRDLRRVEYRPDT
jgi:hypothetical protein